MVRRPRRLAFPLIVKSATLDASIGISQASVVEDDAKLEERVRFIHQNIGTDALVEEYIEGRELYVGILGDKRLEVLPIWELSFDRMPEESRRIATERLKWSLTYRKKHAIVSGPARALPDKAAARIRDMCKRVYRALMLSGYARIDLRLREDGVPYVLEANPNPQLSSDEDFADSARAAGIEYGALVQRIVELGLRWEPSRLS
jgi:D-alanine-D-alanine ligase